MLVASATDTGFQRVPHVLGWVRLGLLVLRSLAGYIQHFKSAILDAWRDTVSADTCVVGKGLEWSSSGCFWYLAAPSCFSLWAETADQGAGNMLEYALGTCSSRLLFDWSLPDEFDATDAALRLLDNPNVWTYGSLVLDKVSGASSSSSGFYAHLLGQSWRSLS